MAGVHAAQAFGCGNQRVAPAVLADGKDFIAGQAVAGGVDNRLSGASELDQPAVMEADPDTVVAILIDGGGFIAREALRLAIDGEDVVAQAVESTVGADPQV